LPPPDKIICADGGLACFDALRRLGAFGAHGGEHVGARGGPSGAAPDAAEAPNTGAAPDALVGDFDSADASLVRAYEARGVPIERHPAQKDQTDSELAFSRAAAMGCSSILALGALGGRVDHALANIHLLARAAKAGIRAAAADECNALSAVASAASAAEMAVQDGNPGAMLVARDFALASMLGLKPAQPSASKYGMRMRQSNAPPPPPKLSILPLCGDARGVRTAGLKYPINGQNLPHDYITGVSNEFSSETAIISVEKGILLVIVSFDFLVK
jgi:thiamine pyrophosphokinase